jgi:NhaP-type Na+/H+ or K+/H+ antiporter
MAVVVSVGVPLALLACLLFILTGLGIKSLNAARAEEGEDGCSLDGEVSAKVGAATSKDPIWCHESSVVALFGLLLGGIFKYANNGKTISFNSDLFFYMVLPPIIFSAGYSLKRKKFFRYGLSITVFGILGTVINFLLISLAARLFAVVYGLHELNWYNCMMLGSVLSATDEVSAMSFIRMKDFPQLGALIFGEGVLNDSLSIVLFKSISEDSAAHAASTLSPPYVPSAVIDASLSHRILKKKSMLDAAPSALKFATEACGRVFLKVLFQLLFSSLIGVGCGLLCALVFKLVPTTSLHPIHQTSLVLLFGMLAYSLAGKSGLLK